MRPYLEGYRFTVLTDHQSLKWLRTMDNPSGRLARWGLELQEYDFDIQYRKGANNLVADALSRKPDEDTETTEVANIEAPTGCAWYDRIRAATESAPHRYPEYHVVNGRLYRHISDTHGPRSEGEWKLCVPQPLREAVLHENHDAPTAGHLGASKTAARLAQYYFWPGMVRDATRYVRRCQKCLEYKALQQAPAGGMQTTPAANPWEVVAVDLVGPLPRSAKGCTMLAVMQDKFSKWVELQPLRQATAPAVTRAFKERIVLRFGCPRRVISDNGRQYESKEFTGMLRKYGIEHRRTPPYTPQCNPVERVNRVIKTMIAQLADGDHRHWDHWLPEIMFAYNTARHDSTGYTPAYLNYGREPAIPGAIRQPTTTIADEDTKDQTADRAEDMGRLREAVRLARHAQAQATEAQKRAYNLRRRDWRPRIGDEVMLREHPLSSAAKNFAAKLAPKFSGPHVVKEYVGPNLVLLRNGRKQPRRAHIQDLKPCGGEGGGIPDGTQSANALDPAIIPSPQVNTEANDNTVRGISKITQEDEHQVASTINTGGGTFALE